LASKGTITGAQLELVGNDELVDAAQNHTIFARISPEQKARLITPLRRNGRSVGFLGDVINDALAPHAADVGISVDSATDVGSSTCYELTNWFVLPAASATSRMAAAALHDIAYSG
jgi:P-type E1-E2 ATPase